jgi:hypothetical protein
MPSPARLDDPEQDVMTTVSLQAPSSALPTGQISSIEFKVNSLTVDKIGSQMGVASEKPKPPPKKSRRKVGRLIRFSLWFNTYRWVLFVFFPKTLSDFVNEENSLCCPSFST